MSSKLMGFMELNRKEFGHRAIEDRLKDFDNVYTPLSDDEMIIQANRCMD